MKPIVTIVTCILLHFAYSQSEQQDDQWLSVGKTNIIFGLNQGSHPNLVNAKLNVNASIESAIIFKDIPLHLSGRFSTERFISGKPTFFRVSYDGYRRKGFDKRHWESELVKTTEAIGKYQDSLYKIEGQIAYWQLKKEQLQTGETPAIPELPSLGRPELNLPPLTGKNLDSLNPEINQLPEINRPNVSEPSLDSINEVLNGLNKNLSSFSQKKDSLLTIKQNYIHQINSIDLKKPLSILGGIDRLDLGLTSMSGGSMSNNTIPVQGIRVKGKYRKSFYDAAAGTTVPNRLFSNSVFDQMTNNTQNIFNINQLYTVNSSRFISSVIIGYGNPEKHSISVENYYNGRELKAILSGIHTGTNLTSNLSGTWLFSENWQWSASLGKTFALNDSTRHSLEQDLALSIGTRYQLKKWRSEFYAKVKRVGSQYDGYSQGLYNSGFSKQEAGINARLTKRLSSQLIFVRQVFDSKSTSFQGMRTTSGTVDFQWNATRKWMIYGGYTLLKASGYDTLARGMNHLGKAGFTWLKKGKSFQSHLSGLAAYSNVKLIDSNLRLVNISLHETVDWRILGGGLQLSFQDYTGLAKIYGANWIIKPELKIHHKGFSFSAAYQLLLSEQFGRQSGFSCKLLASPSEHLTWEITGAKWLPTEALYIPLFQTERFIPYYFDLKLRVYLNRNK
jgi:hypothetical protein